jgi:hypothetical protein
MLALLGLLLVKLAVQLAMAGLAAGVLLAPNLACRIVHGWPTLEFLPNHDAAVTAENSPSRFLLEQLLPIGFAAVPLRVGGLVDLLRRPRFGTRLNAGRRDRRWLGRGPPAPMAWGWRPEASAR